MLKVVRFLELMWLVIAILSFLIGTYKLVTLPVFMDALFFYFFAMLALFLFFLRKNQRKKMEKHASGK